MIRINVVNVRFFPPLLCIYLCTTSGVQTAENKFVHGTAFICGIIEFSSYWFQYFVVKITQMTVVPWISHSSDWIVQNSAIHRCACSFNYHEYICHWRHIQFEPNFNWSNWWVALVRWHFNLSTMTYLW